MNNNPKYLTHLRQGLTTQFKLDELISLCTDVGIDFEDLGGEGKNGKARELIAYCQRRGQLEALVALCEILRPQFPWRDPSAPISAPDPVPTPFNLENSIVAILGEKGKILGTGFVVAGPFIVTCAHVVYKLTGDVMVRPHTHSETYLADIVALSSSQPKAPGQKDVAVLRPRAPWPSSLTPLTFSAGLSLQDRPFITFGYPPAGAIRGLHARGVVRGRVLDETGLPFLQLDSKEVDHGMSGAPVVDVATQQVVGMVSGGFNLAESAKLRDLVLAVPGEIVQGFLPGNKPVRRENPFGIRGRINDPTRFFGRQRELREIHNELRKHSSISLVGPSQIGKSSLLYTLYQTASTWLSDTTSVFLDLQTILDEADFCSEILTRLGEAGDTLRQLKNTLRGRNLLLILDEVERLAEPDFNPRLHDLLRALAQEPHFALCLASQRPLVNVFPARTTNGLSPFHNIFVEKTLGPFTEPEARTFLSQRLLETPVQFTPTEIDDLLQQSQCHPAQLQRLAKLLFDRYAD
ncbi:MAG: serine protease [Chloroflexi bacterium]|nr:serine protease [Chloroflexota bacterium]MBP8055240.1 serine protease [Chloroflexota bacterium]